MKKFIVLGAVLLSGVVFAQDFKISKDKLISVQQKFIASQKQCRKMESQLNDDPFLTDLDGQMDEGVKAGELSQKAADRVKKMIGLIVDLSEDLCTQIDAAVIQIDKQMKSDDETSVFSLVDIEKGLMDTVESTVLELIELSKAPELPVEEQSLLRVIGDVMQRAADKIAEESASNQTQN